MVVDQEPGAFWRRIFRRVEGEAGDPTELLDELPQARLTKRLARDPASAIGRESALGYDLVVLGATESREGTFNTVIDRVLSRVGVPTVVVRFPESYPVSDDLPRRILVPVAATRSTRASEEFAYSVAKAAGGQVFALHVVNRPDGQGLIMENESVDEALRAGRELVGTAAVFGNRLGVTVETGVRVAPNAEAEIVRFANSGSYELLVLGTSRYFSDRPFYGHRVSYILETAAIPVVVISLPPSRLPTKGSDRFGPSPRKMGLSSTPNGRAPRREGRRRGNSSPETLRQVDRSVEAPLEATTAGEGSRTRGEICPTPTRGSPTGTSAPDPMTSRRCLRPWGPPRWMTSSPRRFPARSSTPRSICRRPAPKSRPSPD
jgi:nucleotide-binding universal stress UspA family protein